MQQSQGKYEHILGFQVVIREPLGGKAWKGLGMLFVKRGKQTKSRRLLEEDTRRTKGTFSRLGYQQSHLKLPCSQDIL